MCRNDKTNDLILGSHSQQMNSIDSQNICPNYSNIASPRNIKEVIKISSLLKENNENDLWISLFLNKSIGKSLNWNLINLSDNKIIINTTKTEENYYIFAIGISSFAIIAIILLGALLWKIFIKNKYIHEKKLIPSTDGEKTPKTQERNLSSKRNVPIKTWGTKFPRNVNDTSFNIPEIKATNPLKLDEVQHFALADNENILTNIDNSPDSMEESSRQSSVRQTPKNINFQIEFSMIEQDSKIKTTREAFDNFEDHE